MRPHQDMTMWHQGLLLCPALWLVLTATLAGSVPSRSEFANCTKTVKSLSRDEAFFCTKDNKCIEKHLECDGNSDCSDGQDELNCEKKCGPDSFRCHDNTACISIFWQCDGDYDCSDKSDEADCSPVGERHVQVKSCLEDEFQCNSGLCISKAWKCDGTSDCPDSSDEGDQCLRMECVEGTFRCSNDTTACFPISWKCDGRKDCDNGFDEALCESDCKAEEGKFLCKDHSQCLTASYVCNGKKDCIDGSDEGVFCQSACKRKTCEHQCLKNEQNGTCFCNPGYVMGAAGVCLDQDECQTFGQCSQACTNVIGSFRCSCDRGYDLFDNTRCVPNTGGSPMLVYSDQHEVRALWHEGTFTRAVSVQRDLKSVNESDVNEAIGVAFDPVDKRVYWTAIRKGREGIMSSFLDGSDVRHLVNQSLFSIPEGIAIDYLGRNVYFTDSFHSMVAVASILREDWRILISHGLHRPRNIALYPEKGLMFITDWGEWHPRVIKASMDGTNIESLVTDSVKWPNGVAVDKTLNRVFWSDAHFDTVESVKLDGSDRQQVPLANKQFAHPFAIAIFADTLYWSDWESKEIHACNKFTGKNFTTIVKDLRKPMGIVIEHGLLRPNTLYDPCSNNLCEGLCLANDKLSYTCACGNEYVLDEDGFSCIHIQGRSMDLGQRLFASLGMKFEDSTTTTTTTTTITTSSSSFSTATTSTMTTRQSTTTSTEEELYNPRDIGTSEESMESSKKDDERKQSKVFHDETDFVSKQVVAEEDPDNTGLIVGLVLFLILLLAIILAIVLFKRHRERKSSILLRFRNPEFRRDRLPSSGEELLDVNNKPRMSLSTPDKLDSSVNELHNPVFSSMMHHPSPRTKRYEAWPNAARLDENNLKRAVTNPNLAATPDSRSGTLASQKSGASSANFGLSDEDYEEAMMARDSYKDTEHLLP